MLGIVLNFASSSTPTTDEKLSPNNSNIEPTVTYNMNEIDSKNSYAEIKIGNQNISGTFIVERLTINWDYSECLQLTNESDVGGLTMEEFKYSASLTQRLFVKFCNIQ
ncbi:hypothetical protein [Okeania sp. KiyG1]|uniref:hypothetical protein n=1 Tax=Okeania sp. KiyG1 TaxID=2720165 RepID=UPI001924AC72|nr:hypothetical protein [Okeania sp. KiyG1]GGA32795.1 hypothetical protein CYANOKiyG1_49680 [Okeania sp. KiyG1]